MARNEELTELLKGVSSGASPSSAKIKKRNITARAPAIDQMQSIQSSIQETMPVSKKTVRFKFTRVDPKLVDVHPRIPRSQQMLNKQSVSDIFESIKDSGQREPCLVRPKENGRFELLDGSRRFFCIRTIGDRDLFIKVGDIPEEDVDAFFELSDQKLKHSDWEKGIYYLKFVPDPYPTKKEAQMVFSAREKVSETTIFYRMQLAELPDYFVALFDTPNEISRRDLQFFRKESAKNERGVRTQLKKLYDKKMAALSSGVSVAGKDLIKELKQALSQKSLKVPVAKRTLVYKNAENREVLKYRVTSSGNHVFELVSASDDEIEKIQKALQEVLSITE